MDKLETLISLCSGSVDVNINGHKDLDMSLLIYLGDDIGISALEDISKDMYSVMVERDTFVQVQVQEPNSDPIYTYHYDLNTAIDLMIEKIKK